MPLTQGTYVIKEYCLTTNPIEIRRNILTTLKVNLKELMDIFAISSLFISYKYANMHIVSLLYLIYKKSSQ